MIRYQYTFQAEPRKIITRQKSDFFPALGSQFPLQTVQTMQTLCKIEMTAISGETIEKCEDRPIINACLGEIDVQNTTNCKGISNPFLNGYDIKSNKNIGQLMIFC